MHVPNTHIFIFIFTLIKAYNFVFHGHTKHIKIDCYIIHEKICLSILKTIHTSSHEQVVDIFTKVLGHDLFHLFSCKLGIMDLYVPT